MISPVGKGVRMDAAGSGRFGAHRGARTHDGVDWLADPGDPVYAPSHGIVTRIVYPYAEDKSFEGVEIASELFITHLLYVEPLDKLVGKVVKAGDLLGTAQDVRRHYPNLKDMKCHIHHRVYANPVYFM